MSARVRCPECGYDAHANARGEVLLHTTPATGGKPRRDPGAFFGMPDVPVPAYVPAKICPGSTRGARP